MISPKVIEDKLKLVPAISNAMELAIDEWYSIYKNKKQYDDCGNPMKSLNLGYTIASEKARMACLEMSVAVYDPSTESEEGLDEQEDVTTRASYINQQIRRLLKTFRHDIEPGLALGTMVIKPIVDSERGVILFDHVLANEFFPINFTLDGKLTSAVFVEILKKKDVTYTRLETHELKNGVITIKQEAYHQYSNASNELGTKISLSEVTEWSNLQPETKIVSSNSVKLDRLLVACYVNPEANSIDIHSKLGVSVYSAAVDLIKDANEVYSGLMWELQAGEMAIDAPRNAIKAKLDDNGNEIGSLPRRLERLFREVSVSNAQGDDLYKVHNPAFRDVSYINVLNSVLSKIEDKVALARGTISDVQLEAKTATEIKSLKQRTYQSNKDIQESLEDLLQDVIYIIDIYTSLYNLAPMGEYDTRFGWDDSILVDVAEELRQKNSLTSNGGLFPEEVAAWYNDETLEQRFQQIQKYKELKQQYDPEVEESLE